MNRFRQAWQALCGRDFVEEIEALIRHSDKTYGLFLEVIGKRDQLRSDLAFAKASIKDLQSKLREAQQKKASDMLGEAVIADMLANPKKYLP